MADLPTLRQRWALDETTLGVWLSVASSVSAEAAARAGFDYVCIDTQHGALDYVDAVPMIQAIVLGGSCPIARVPWNEPSSIGKMLDAGAHGVIVPMVNTATEAEAAVRACRYAPAGARSTGPTVAKMRTDQPYFEWAAEHVACIPMIETKQAVDNLDEILAVPGIDMVQWGPADYAMSIGKPGGWFDDEVKGVERAVLAKCIAAGVRPRAEITHPDQAAYFTDQGVKDFCIGTDLNILYSWLDERGGALGDLIGWEGPAHS